MNFPEKLKHIFTQINNMLMHKRPHIKWILFFIFIFTFWSLFFYAIPSADGIIFRSAAHSMIKGNSPYIEGFFNPPWALLPVIPLLIFPDKIADGILVTLNALCIFAVAYKLGARGLLLLVILFSPCVIVEMWSANNTGIVLLGIIMPPQAGLFFLLIKPQIGLPIAVFWLVESWRSGKVKDVIRVFSPVTIAFFISFLLYGLWPLKVTLPTNAYWNMSVWPAGIPIGLVLLITSFRNRDIRYSMLAAPFLTPYLAFHGYTIALIGLLPSITNTAVGFFGMWLFMIFNGGWSIRNY